MSVSTELEILVESNGDLVMNNLKISAEKLSKAIEGVHKTQKSAFENMASTISSVTIAVRGVSDSFQQLAQPVQDFDKAMRAANTMAGKDAAGFKELTGQVKDLSKEIPIARELLANGLYQTISNGVPEDNWIEFLRASARSAVGGMANLEEVVKVTSTVIKNYGLDWEQAAAIQDKIQLTAKNGVTSFEQLAAALPRVTGNAATLGVSIDELMATFSTLTGVSGNTAEVSTQLAAVFTALIKPSSEATKMAAQMGLQFNAAAITSAGGLQNFLRQLDAAVKSYAASSGVLEQEVYGRLFGSAESLRAIGPLTGELATKFQENVSAMTGSAGTMDAAFETMASTGESVAQRIKNQLSGLTDIIGNVAAACLPAIQYVSSLGMALSGAGTIATTAKSIFSSLNGVLTKHGVYTKISTLAISAWGSVMTGIQPTIRCTSVIIRQLSAAASGATISMRALKVAIRGLLASTVVGVVIAAIGFALERLISYLSKTKEATAEARDYLAEYTNTSQEAAQYMESYTRQLDSLYKTATNAAKSDKERASAAQELKKVYSEWFGTLSTEEIMAGKAAAAYNSLTEAMLKNAKTKAAMDKIVENGKRAIALDEERENTFVGHTNARDFMKGYKDAVDLSNKTMRAMNSTNNPDLRKGLEKEYLAAKVEVDKYFAAIEKAREGKYNINTSDLYKGKGGSELARFFKDNELKFKVEEKSLELAQQKLQRVVDDNPLVVIPEVPAPDINTNNHPDNKKNNQIKTVADLKKPLEEKIEQKKLEWVKAKGNESLQRSIMTEISLLKDQLDEIDSLVKQVDEYTNLKIEKPDPAPKTAEQVTTYAELDEALRGHQKLLDNATVGERAAIAKQIKALEDLRDKWNKALQVPPGAPDTLQTLDEVNSAIEYYNTQLKNAEGTSKTGIENTLAQLKARRKTVTTQERAANRNVELDNELEEVNSINSLSGHDYMVKVRDMGFDTLDEKIKALNMELATLGDGPDTDGQRRKIEELIKNYKQMRNSSMMSVAGFEAVWGATKGVTSGIKAATEAVKGDGSAWEKTVSVVDAAVSVYKNLTQGYQLLAPLITAITAVKKVETTATQEQTGANMANAASGALAANAAIPVVGVAMGVAAVAAIIAAMASVPKYADGGIAYGPTIGMFGEYPGASHNPEVVAPLDKLRSMIQPAGMDGRVEFEIDGTKLRGVLRRVDSRTSRT